MNDPKSKSSRRTIMLAEPAIQALQRHRERQEQERLRAGDTWTDQGLVFTTRQGGFVDPGQVWREFQRLLDKLGLPHMRFHDLRHSAATILLAMKVDLKVIQELLGHSSIVITADIYAHLLPSMQRGAMEKLGEAWQEEKESMD